jgi:hypothetical protein
MAAVTVDLRRLRPHAPRVLTFVRRSSGGGDETARQWEPSSRARIRLGEDTAVGGVGGPHRIWFPAARRILPWPPPPSLTHVGSSHARSARLPPPAGVLDPATGLETDVERAGGEPPWGRGRESRRGRGRRRAAVEGGRRIRRGEEPLRDHHK